MVNIQQKEIGMMDKWVWLMVAEGTYQDSPRRQQRSNIQVLEARITLINAQYQLLLFFVSLQFFSLLLTSSETFLNIFYQIVNARETQPRSIQSYSRRIRATERSERMKVRPPFDTTTNDRVN